MKKVFVVKYLFTEGIEEVFVKLTSIPDMVVEDKKWGRTFHKGDWFDNKEDAISKAKLMKDKKIKSLEKQISKVKAIEL